MYFLKNVRSQNSVLPLEVQQQAFPHIQHNTLKLSFANDKNCESILELETTSYTI